MATDSKRDSIMCGIIGYVGAEPAADIVLDSLRRLEYRGYDSSGIATIDNGNLHVSRAVGKLKMLSAQLAASPLYGTVGIGHTRWATHGGVTELNAHPHAAGGHVAIVHNGIIENYADIKARLIAAGVVFASDTDSEVLAHLFHEAFTAGKTPVDALHQVLSEIKGAFALAAIAKQYPDCLMVARNASPLAIGLSDDLGCIASDAVAMAHLTRRVIYLKDGDRAVIRKGEAEIYDIDQQPANREIVTVSAAPMLVDKGGYRHFMEKEIHEQPDAISHTLSAMTSESGAITAGFETEHLAAIKHIVILAAGTSFYAGQIGRYWIEQIAGIPVSVEVASEYRYRSPVTAPYTTALLISQSGESLDTMKAMEFAKAAGLTTLGIVNVPDSTIARESDIVLPTRAGPEIGVASTKAFTAQLTVLLSLAIALGQQRGRLSTAEADALHAQMMSLPGAIGQAVSRFDEMRPVAHRLSRSHSALFLGRGTLFPLACEAALKLKELSYVHAEGFAAGEMKHGPIALIEEGVPVICFVGPHELSEKTISNLREAEARGADVIVVCTDSMKDIVDFAEFTVTVPDCTELMAPLVMAIPAQIMAYLTASEKGTDVDQPRNLAKSVTVE